MDHLRVELYAKKEEVASMRTKLLQMSHELNAVSTSKGVLNEVRAAEVVFVKIAFSVLRWTRRSVCVNVFLRLQPSIDDGPLSSIACVNTIY